MLKSFIPTPLPQSDAGFADFARDVLGLAGLPVNDSFVNALATQVLHLGPTTAIKSKRYFVLGLRAAVAKQCAYNSCEDIRQREKAARQAAEATRQVVPQVSENGI